MEESDEGGTNLSAPTDVAGLPTVSVVVTTYNRRTLLPDVLRPLLEDPGATEVIVVVDGSQDGSRELLEEMARDEPRLKPIFIPNAGQTAAQQRGLEEASGEVVLVVDDDVVPGPGLATGHARRHARRDGIVVIGYMPTRVPAGRSPSRFTSVLYAAEYEGAARSYVEEPDAILLGLWMGNVSLRREDARRVGFHNPVFVTSNFGSGKFYFSDRDFGLRCAKAGLVGVHDRDLSAEHVHERSLSAFLVDARDQGIGFVRIHQLHPDLLGSFDVDGLSGDLPAPVRALVRSARNPRVGSVAAWLLHAWLRVAGAVGASRLQLPAARLTRRIEQQRGALTELRSTTP